MNKSCSRSSGGEGWVLLIQTTPACLNRSLLEFTSELNIIIASLNNRVRFNNFIQNNYYKLKQLKYHVSILCIL